MATGHTNIPSLIGCVGRSAILAAYGVMPLYPPCPCGPTGGGASPQTPQRVGGDPPKHACATLASGCPRVTPGHPREMRVRAFFQNGLAGFEPLNFLKLLVLLKSPPYPWVLRAFLPREPGGYNPRPPGVPRGGLRGAEPRPEVPLQIGDNSPLGGPRQGRMRRYV